MPLSLRFFFLFGLIGVGITTGGAQTPDTPIFRAEIALTTVEVSVLDGNRQPVRGLSAADFQILEDGTSRPVEAVVEVDVPAPQAMRAAWLDTTPRDVAVNTDSVGGRLVVLVIDDGSFNETNLMDPTAVAKARQIGRDIVNALGPADLGAVVFTAVNGTAQNFTSDKTLLLRAIDAAPLFPSPSEHGVGGDCYCGLCSVDVPRRVADSLAQIVDRRKVIFYVSGGRTTVRGPALISQSLGNWERVCESRRGDEFDAFLAAAQAANVTIHAIDPGGLRSKQPPGLHDFLRTVAENTGGRPVVNDNDPERLVADLLAETSSYYVLGFRSESSGPASRARALRVRVVRPGMRVLARTEVVPRAARTIRSRSEGLNGLDLALAQAVPSADMPLAVTVAPFAENGSGAALAIVLGVQQLDALSGPESLASRGGSTYLDVTTRVFTPEGRQVAQADHRLNVVIRSASSDTWHFESLSRVSVAPGRYEVRLAVRTASGRTSGVNTYVTVPDFAKADLALSGLVIEATPPLKSAPSDLFSDLTPVVPTARRVFTRSDQATAFVRAYQKDRRTPIPVTAYLRAVDASGIVVVNQSFVVMPDDFRPSSAALQLPIPLTKLRSGAYLVTVGVSNGVDSLERSSKIEVR